MWRALRGSASLLHIYPRAYAPGLDSFASFGGSSLYAALRFAARWPAAARNHCFLILTRHLFLSACNAPRNRDRAIIGRPARRGTGLLCLNSTLVRPGSFGSFRGWGLHATPHLALRGLATQVLFSTNIAQGRSACATKEESAGEGACGPYTSAQGRSACATKALVCETSPWSHFIRENSSPRAARPLPARANHTSTQQAKDTRVETRACRGPVCYTSVAKKLRYMSKFAAIIVRTDNTHVSCTQPIANLPMACL